MKVPNRNKHRKQQRQAMAEKLAKERADRSPAQQLALLDERLGKGVGAKKERARLNKLMSRKQKVKAKKRVAKKNERKKTAKN